MRRILLSALLLATVVAVVLLLPADSPQGWPTGCSGLAAVVEGPIAIHAGFEVLVVESRPGSCLPPGRGAVLAFPEAGIELGDVVFVARRQTIPVTIRDEVAERQTFAVTAMDWVAEPVFEIDGSEGAP